MYHSFRRPNNEEIKTVQNFKTYLKENSKLTPHLIEAFGNLLDTPGKNGN